MIALESVYTNITGVHPDVLAINSTGAATPDGTEFIAEGINNESFGFVQALMDWANGGTNAPGAVGVPSGVTESAGVSQLLDAIQKGHAIGPGFSYPRYINDSPAVHGDRSLLLAEQGVLIATYPDLDAATWITGNTAAQITAEAAGEKFYRSSDAGGATGDAAGPYLQLPANLSPSFLKQYSLTVTGSNWTTTGAFGIPYQTIDGIWRFIFNIDGDISIGASSLTITVSGVTFRSGIRQAVAGHQTTGSNRTVLCLTNTSASTININVTGNELGFSLSGDVELTVKPTWADDFTVPWAITY